MQLFARKYIYDDGGRRKAGYRRQANDCVVRAIAIASEMPYESIRTALEAMAKAQSRQCVDKGVFRETFHPLLTDMGWHYEGPWMPTPIWDIPLGRVICRLQHHLVAVIDGMPHDTHNAFRGKKRDILAYYTPPS